jgi:hypothetical protein
MTVDMPMNVDTAVVRQAAKATECKAKWYESFDQVKAGKWSWKDDRNRRPTGFGARMGAAHGGDASAGTILLADWQNEERVGAPCADAL